MSDSVRPYRRQPTRLLCPWDSPGKNTGVGCHFLLQCMEVKREREVIQSCPSLRNPMDCSLPGSSIHGIFQARVLEWDAIAFSTGVKLRTTFPRFLLGRVWLDAANERHLCELWNSGPGLWILTNSMTWGQRGESVRVSSGREDT